MQPSCFKREWVEELERLSALECCGRPIEYEQPGRFFRDLGIGGGHATVLEYSCYLATGPFRVMLHPSLPNAVKRFHGTGGAALLPIIKGRSDCAAVGFSCNHDLRPVNSAGGNQLKSKFGELCGMRAFPVCCLAPFNTAVGYAEKWDPTQLGIHSGSGVRFQARFVLEFEAKWQDHFLKLDRRSKTSKANLQYFYAPWFLHLTAVWILPMVSCQEAFTAWFDSSSGEGRAKVKMNNLRTRAVEYLETEAVRSPKFHIMTKKEKAVRNMAKRAKRRIKRTMKRPAMKRPSAAMG